MSKFKMVVIDEDNTALFSKDLADPNFIAMYNGPNGTPNVFKNCEHFRLDEKNTIKQIYAETARKVREKFKDYIGHVSVDRVMYLVDEEWEPNDKTTPNSMWKIGLKKTTAFERKVTGFQYKMLLRTHWLEQWDDAHLNAAMFAEFLRIDPQKGQVRNYTEEFQSAMVKTLGDKYLDPESRTPDILTDDSIEFIGLPPVEVQEQIPGTEKLEAPKEE